MRFRPLPFLLAAALALGACSSALEEAHTPVAEQGCGVEPLHVAEGLATYYGKRFHGRKTASGERYDRFALTAAHRDYPFGTYVRVTNARTGISVIVRINDRGPRSTRRLIDLSGEAAHQLDMLRAGVAPVRLEVMAWGGSAS
jgi:rare lipoprotein A